MADGSALRQVLEGDGDVTCVDAGALADADGLALAAAEEDGAADGPADGVPAAADADGLADADGEGDGLAVGTGVGRGVGFGVSRPLPPNRTA